MTTAKRARIVECACALAVAAGALVTGAGRAEQTPAGAAPSGKAAVTFRAEQIAADFGIGYAVTTGDVNGDGRTDVVAINATDLVWFEAPTWQKRTIITGLTPKDNVCLSLNDIDRDGRLDVALGASWQPTNTSSGGTLHWVRQGAPGADWELHSIAEEPTLHRIRWADLDGDNTRELVVVPLHGRGTKGPDWQGQGARILVFRPPANPARDPWPVEVADDTLHIVHNFLPANMDGDAGDELLVASREGVHLLRPPGQGQGRLVAHAHRRGCAGRDQARARGWTAHDRHRRAVAWHIRCRVRGSAWPLGAHGHRAGNHRRPRARLGRLRRRRQRRAGRGLARQEPRRRRFTPSIAPAR